MRASRDVSGVSPALVTESTFRLSRGICAATEQEEDKDEEDADSRGDNRRGPERRCRHVRRHTAEPDPERLLRRPEHGQQRGHGRFFQRPAHWPDGQGQPQRQRRNVHGRR